MNSDFKNLKVWEESHKLSIEVYKLATLLPPDEKFGLTSQLKRAAISIELNISEGCGRKTDKEFISFLFNSLGSCKEVENILILLKDLNLISNEQFVNITSKNDIIGKMLSNLIKARQI